MSNKLEHEKLTLPEGHDQLLLLSFCATCSDEMMEALIESGINFFLQSEHSSNKEISDP